MQENGTATGLTNQNKSNRKKRYINIAIILALWLLSGFILGLFTDGTSKDLHIEISSPRVQIGSLEVNKRADIITIDLPARTINVEVAEEELAKRAETLPVFEPKIKKGWLARYSSLVTSASTGGTMKF